MRLCADFGMTLSPYMKTRADLGDPEECLRSARWCQINNLKARKAASPKTKRAA